MTSSPSGTGEPFAVLAEHGIEYPEGFPPPLVPEKPEGDLSQENLEAITAGSEPRAPPAP